MNNPIVLRLNYSTMQHNLNTQMNNPIATVPFAGKGGVQVQLPLSQDFSMSKPSILTQTNPTKISNRT